MNNPLTHNRGFTLIEVILVVVIAGILASVTFRSAGKMSETVRVEETKQELDALAFAIAGNPELQNNGVRSDFGYVGDVGAMPANLDALKSNPGGYSTWKGPYINNRLSQISDDYKKDAWGVDYGYSSNVTITSNGSGSDIVRRLANSTDDLVRNTVNGVIVDVNGTPPGHDYKDSVSARLTIPDGSGSLVTKSSSVDAGGYFTFDSIPIGNHDIEIIYLPDNDTLERFVSVLPSSSIYSEYHLASDVWFDSSVTASRITFVTNSDTLWTGNCSELKFWVENNSGAAITVNSIKLTWTSPTAYYKKVTWAGTTVRDSNPSAGSGETSSFSSAQTINNGQQLMVTVEQFKPNAGGSGSPVDMTNTEFTVELSEGSTFTYTADLCN